MKKSEGLLTFGLSDCQRTRHSETSPQAGRGNPSLKVQKLQKNRNKVREFGTDCRVGLTPSSQ